MSLGEIRLRLGVSRQRAHQLTMREDWPAVYERLSIGRVWRTADVEAWIKQNRPALAPADEPEGGAVKCVAPRPRPEPAE